MPVSKRFADSIYRIVLKDNSTADNYNYRAIENFIGIFIHICIQFTVLAVR